MLWVRRGGGGGGGGIHVKIFSLFLGNEKSQILVYQLLISDE